MSTFFTLLLFGAAIAFYLLPMVIAAARNCQHSGAIFFINMLFGWTVLGWIAALIWAIVEAPEEKHKVEPAPLKGKRRIYENDKSGDAYNC